MPNIVAISPTDDSFEEILTQGDCQIQGVSIADTKYVRFTDRDERGNDIYPKRPGAHGPQDPEDISQFPRGEDMQLGRQHHLSYKEGLKNNLQLAATEFCKMWDPKIMKLKEGYSSNVSLIFQPWLQDIHINASE